MENDKEIIELVNKAAAHFRILYAEEIAEGININGDCIYEWWVAIREKYTLEENDEPLFHIVENAILNSIDN